MALATWLRARWRVWRGGADREPLYQCIKCEALVRAHGDWLALLATILERESIIPGDELAVVLRDFAALTAADRPAEGQILSFWAAYLQDRTAALGELPSLH